MTTLLKQDLYLAARATSVYNAAINYSVHGLSVLPCRGKQPAVTEWKAFQRRPATFEDVIRWDQYGLLENVGIICGAVSGNLVVVDLDGDEAIAAFAKEFPQLLDTYTVASGSGQGAHLYYYTTRELPPTTRVVGGPCGNVELRANGCYVVAPPSIHPGTGKPYVVSNPAPVHLAFNLLNVVDWIKELIRQKHGGIMPPLVNRQPVQRVSNWAAAALAAETTAIRHALPGARNNTLNRAAFKLGQLIGGGLLERSHVEDELLMAAEALCRSDGAETVVRTIRSGLDAGIANPRGKATA